MTNFSQIKNIVFDLGGVIINLDFDKTYNAFSQLAGISPQEIIALFEKEQFFKNYETGKFTESEFLSLLQQKIGNQGSLAQVTYAWNALLLDIPQERILKILALKDKYNLFLLSNTNDTHIQEVNKILETASGVTNLNNLFTKAYYSYEIGLIKPDLEIYQHLCEDSKLIPAETLFLDDSELNIRGATKAGWNTLHVKNDLTILELLQHA